MQVAGCKRNMHSTYIANVLGVAAGRDFCPVRYVRLPDLLAELSIASKD